MKKWVLVAVLVIASVSLAFAQAFTPTKKDNKNDSGFWGKTARYALPAYSVPRYLAVPAVADSVVNAPVVLRYFPTILSVGPSDTTTARIRAVYLKVTCVKGDGMRLRIFGPSFPIPADSALASTDMFLSASADSASNTLEVPTFVDSVWAWDAVSTSRACFVAF